MELENKIENIEIKEKKISLGDRMKMYENNSLEITKIHVSENFIVRLDGRSFSKFTSGFKKPFDFNFLKAMYLTTSDLLNEFHGVTGYTHSDEISIIFSKLVSDEEIEELKKLKREIPTHLFDGRVVKILTTMSSYCSVRFNYHLIKIMKEANDDNYSENFLNKINECSAVFDARLILFPKEKSNEEILNHMYWRSVYDCERNAVSTYARNYFSQNQLHGKSKVEMIELMNNEKKLNWEKDVPIYWKHGIYLKREFYEKKIEINEHNKENNNNKNNENDFILRKRTIGKCLKIHTSPCLLKFVLSKEYNLEKEDEEKLGVINFNL